MSDDDGSFSVPDDSREETVGEALADYLALIDETIRTQVTDDEIRARIRHAKDQAASRQDAGPPDNVQPGRAPGQISGGDADPARRDGRAAELRSSESGELRN